MTALPILAGRYHVLRPLGRGGMGEILLVREGGPDGPERALKRLHLAGDEAIARFRDEFATLARIEHPNIVRVFDYGMLPAGEGGDAYFTMEFLAGVPIDEAIAPGDIPATLRATLEILAGLDTLGAAGIVHCDLKPSNVMIVRGGDGTPQAKLLDFGFAGKADTAADAQVRGTPGYVAPEILGDAPLYTRASDAYALGATLYRILAGRVAFPGRDAIEVLAAQRRGRPSALPLRAAGVPHALEVAILGLMDEDRERRLVHLDALRMLAAAHAGSAGAPGVGARGSVVGRAAELEALRSHLFRDRTQLSVLRGRPGSGRTRLAREIAVEAELAGRRVAWLDAETTTPQAEIARVASAPGAGILLVLDDVDAWPGEGLRALDLAGLHAPLALLATVDASRSAESWSAGLLALPEDPRRQDIELGELSPEEIRALLASRLGGGISARIFDFVRRQAGDAPGPLHRTLDVLLRADALRMETGGLHLDEATGLAALGHAGGDELAVRLERLSPEARAALLALAFEADPGATGADIEAELSWLDALRRDEGGLRLRSPGWADRVRAALLPSADTATLARVETALDSAPQSGRALRLRGELDLARGDARSARDQLLAAIRRPAEDSPPDRQAALDLLVPILTDEPHDRELLPELAECEAGRGRFEAAAELLARVLAASTELAPDRRLTLVLRRSALLTEKGDVRGALAVLDAATELVGPVGGESMSWHFQRANALRLLGRGADSLHEYELALASAPPDDLDQQARVRNRYGIQLYLEGHHERGKAMLEAARSLVSATDPLRLQAVISANLGLIARLEGEYEEAVVRQVEAVEMFQQFGSGPDVIQSLGNLASIYANMGAWSDFEATIGRAMELARQRRDPHQLLGLIATCVPASLRRGRFAEVRRLQRIERAWLPSIDFQEARVHHEIYVGERLRLEGRLRAAGRRWDQLLHPKRGTSLHGSRALTAALRGRLHARASRPETALDDFAAAIELRPADLRVTEIVLPELRRLASLGVDADRIEKLLAKVRIEDRLPESRKEEIAAWQELGRGQLPAAMQHARRALELDLKMDHRTAALEFGTLMGIALIERGAAESGTWLLQDSFGLARDLGLRSFTRRIAEALLELGPPGPRAPTGAGSSERETLYRVSEVLNSAVDPTVLLPRALSLVCERMGAQRGFILLHDDQGEPQPVAQFGQVDEETRTSALDISRTVIRKVTSSGETFRSDDAASDPRLISTLSVLDLSMRSILCTPLRIADEGIGTIYLENRATAGQFDEEQLDLVEAFANVVAVAIRNARLTEELRRARDRALGESASLRREVGGRFRATNIIGQSPEIERVLFEIERMAPSRTSVLITGESGTGKDLVAKTIHFASPRASRPFLSLNCAALPAELIESELFGIEDRVATGVRGRPGYFERANGGTLFLDEIGDMPPALQVKLLRVLQEREFTRIGGSQIVRVDVRLITATHRDLDELIREGKFREDLYFRIQGLPIHLPPLRERKADIPLLARHFLERACDDGHLPVPRMSAEFQTTLLRSNWPGNVRELQNYIERSLVMSAGPVLEPIVLPSDLAPQRPSRPRRRGEEAAGAELSGPPADLKHALEDVERRWIRAALDNAESNQRRAAALLGLAEPTLRYRMGKLGITPPGPVEAEDAAGGSDDERPRSQKPARKSRK